MRTDTGRRAAVLGSPVAHSLSPVLHDAAYQALGLTGWSYQRVECDADRLPGLVSELDEQWVGLSVTMPGKQAALAVASSVTDRAAVVGAANTLTRMDSGLWRADCTDVDGVTGALDAAGARVSADGPAVILGAGGTANAAIAALPGLGIDRVLVVAREPARAAEAVACAGRAGVHCEVLRWADVDFGPLAAESALLVNTAPGAALETIVDALAKARRILDVIYHPWPTPLAEAVHERGGSLATGLDMLLHQAFGQVEQFTGQPAPRVAMRDALRAATGDVLSLPLAQPQDP
ncbi:shikimate dehydrogenase [Tamaricihabitans halophyticus]|uniref:Shikimate dehydrogenase n=1 Tax=Tamaricihabitans halophyticus TaxID=1262583 RepID=A0A4R2QDG7_9PSEU|nr:shikimate dehydrogenase [Tamaricihabitans halophyticus]